MGVRILPKGDNIPEIGLAILRIGFGLMLTILHGWPTFRALLQGRFSDYPDPIGLGSGLSMWLMGFAEFICAIFLTVGLGTRLVLVPIIIGFSVAFFIYHSGDPMTARELPFLYLLACIALWFTGPGIYSMDYLFGKNNIKTES